MSRNYQMHQMARDEAERFDAIDRAVEAKEAMHREMEAERIRKAKMDALDRELSGCELEQLKRLEGG